AKATAQDGSGVSGSFQVTISNQTAVLWTDQTRGTSAASQNWTTISSSSDGSRLAAVVQNGDIWTSTDSGVTWDDKTPTGAAHNASWRYIASSSDGSHLAAVVQ